MVEEEFKHLVRVAGSDLDGKKKVDYGLTKIKGIGLRMAGAICEVAGIDKARKVGYLTEKESETLGKAVEGLHENGVPPWMYNRRRDYSTGRDIHIIGSDLLMSLRDDLNRLRKIRSYRGIRHETGLPVRGQRTRTGFRGGKTVGVTRKKMIEAQRASKKVDKK
ncbi:MAG: 30S ribosomal protein S13 [Candidatus Hydrothermarchaeaceae archaeon]